MITRDMPRLSPDVLQFIDYPHIFINGNGRSEKDNFILLFVYNLIRYSFVKVEDEFDLPKLTVIAPKRLNLSILKEYPLTEHYASEPDEIIKALDSVNDLIEERIHYMGLFGLKEWDEGTDYYVLIDEFEYLKNDKRIYSRLSKICRLGKPMCVYLVCVSRNSTRAEMIPDLKQDFSSEVTLYEKGSSDTNYSVEFDNIKDSDFRAMFESASDVLVYEAAKKQRKMLESNFIDKLTGRRRYNMPEPAYPLWIERDYLEKLALEKEEW